MTEPTARDKPRRVWQPRPSAAARDQILAAVRALLADPAAEGWTAGYAVRLKDLAEHLAGVLTYPTLRAYAAALTAAGDLRRVYAGLYALPDREAADVSTKTVVK